MIGKRTFERIRKAIRRNEIRPQFGVLPSQGARVLGSMRLGVVSTEITEASGGTWGEGTVDLKYYDGSGLNDLGETVTVTVVNEHTFGIAVGAVVKVVNIDGYWFFFDVDDCTKVT